MLLLNLIHEGIVMRLHLFGQTSGDGVVHDVSLFASRTTESQAARAVGGSPMVLGPQASSPARVQLNQDGSPEPLD